MAEEIQDEWEIFRLVKEKVASLRELEEVYSYEDCLKMNAILDMSSDTEAFISQTM